MDFNIGYNYTYLLMGITLFFIWLPLFIVRKDTRKEMLTMSLIFGFAGPLADLAYFRDWWKPITMNNSWFSIEAILVAAMIGGISSILYEEIFRDRLVRLRTKKINTGHNKIAFIALIALTAFLFYFCYFMFRLNSFYSTIITFIIPTLIVWYKRRDLIITSLLSGILLLSVAVAVYTVLEFLTPGWITEFWYFNNTPRIIICNLPIDDIAWYLLGGMYIGPLYPFWRSEKLIKIKNGRKSGHLI